MAKQLSAHEVIKKYLLKGYSYRELALFWGESPSLLHRIGNDCAFDEHVSLRDKLNSMKPDFEPKRNPKFKKEDRK